MTKPPILRLRLNAVTRACNAYVREVQLLAEGRRLLQGMDAK